jgi:hypothetical protein
VPGECIINGYNPEGLKMRVHGIGEQLELLGRVLQTDPH